MISNTRKWLLDLAMNWVVAGTIGGVLSVLLQLGIIAKQGSPFQIFLIFVTVCAFVAACVYISLINNRLKEAERLLSQLGVENILKRKDSPLVDAPYNAEHSFRFLGISAVNLFTPNNITNIQQKKSPKDIEIISLDAKSITSIQSLANIEGRTVDAINHYIKSTKNHLDSLERRTHNVKNIPCSLIPYFRIVTIDDKTMYVCHYPHKDDLNHVPATGWNENLIVLKKGDENNRSSLFYLFKGYCDRIKQMSIQHLVVRAVIRIKYSDPEISLEKLQEKVFDGLSEFVAPTDETKGLVINTLIEFGMEDNPVS